MLLQAQLVRKGLPLFCLLKYVLRCTLRHAPVSCLAVTAFARCFCGVCSIIVCWSFQIALAPMLM